jgi:hypothetical protein
MMSFAPQRPNFVLVWIGIVLLTFSFLSNFLAGGGGIKGSPPEGRMGRTSDYVVDDTLTLPALSGSTKVIAEESGFRLVSDPLALDPHQFEGDLYPPLADQQQSDFSQDGLDLPLEFPVELLEGAKESVPPAVVRGVGIDEQPEASGPNHAVRPAVHRAGPHVQATTATANTEGSQQNSMYGGNRSHLSSAAGKASKNQDHPDFGANVKARVLASNQRGMVLVSFMLNNPDGQNLLRNQFNSGQVDPKLLAKARNLVQAVHEVDEELAEDDSEQAADQERTKQERVDNMRRRELTRMLRLHPGGIEIIAEMTPKQLRALANKLDARSPKLRALLN